MTAWENSSHAPDKDGIHIIHHFLVYKYIVMKSAGLCKLEVSFSFPCSSASRSVDHFNVSLLLNEKRAKKTQFHIPF